MKCHMGRGERGHRSRELQKRSPEMRAGVCVRAPARRPRADRPDLPTAILPGRNTGLRSPRRWVSCVGTVLYRVSSQSGTGLWVMASWRPRFAVRILPVFPSLARPHSHLHSAAVPSFSSKPLDITIHAFNCQNVSLCSDSRVCVLLLLLRCSLRATF